MNSDKICIAYFRKISGVIYPPKEYIERGDDNDR